MNCLTTLLDLCMDDKTAQSTQKACNRDTGQNVTRVRKLHKTKREQAKTESSDERWITSRQGKIKNTWEASTLTGVSRKQRENKNTCQTHQRVVVATRITKMWHW